MKYLRLSIFLVLILLISACGKLDQPSEKQKAQMMGSVEPFAAVTQDGEDFNVTDLKGQFWIADFIFTNCTTVCLPMTSNMAKLQGMLDEEGLDDVKLVSFSVDPERDTPEVLKAYAEEYGADLDRWTFLTGYDFDTIMNYSIDTFKNLVAPPAEGDDQVSHGVTFFLVDPEGNIVTHVSGTKADQMEDLVNEIKSLK